MQIETDPSKVSPQTHVFIGMFRPPVESIPRNESCNKWKAGWCDVCAGGAANRDDERWKCWLAGHFDIPQYRVIEEAKPELHVCKICGRPWGVPSINPDACCTAANNAMK